MARLAGREALVPRHVGLVNAAERNVRVLVANEVLNVLMVDTVDVVSRLGLGGGLGLVEDHTLFIGS